MIWDPIAALTGTSLAVGPHDNNLPARPMSCKAGFKRGI